MEDRGLLLKGEITMMKAIKNFMNKQWTRGLTSNCAALYTDCILQSSVHLWHGKSGRNTRN